MAARKPHKASLIAMALAGFTLFSLVQRNQVRDAVDDLRAQAQLVTVADGGKLRVRRSGEGNPGYPIILESGIGGTSAQWVWLQAELAKQYQVVSYDRPGMGLSDEVSAAHDGITLVTTLHNMLHAMELKPPYILVGYSFGGLLVRLYRERYPEEVAGLFLVDPEHPREEERLPSKTVEGDHKYYERIKLAGYLSNFGLSRLARIGSMGGPGLPESENAEMALLAQLPRHLYAYYDEAAALPTTLAQTAKVKPLGDIPLGIVSSTKPNDAAVKVLQELHEELLSQSTRSFHAFVDGAEHSTILADKNYAAMVNDYLQNLLALAPSATP